jgi:NAD(P)-dependent dehydrogenase (short-subunit alcohol dehydrogenase family)
MLKDRVVMITGVGRGLGRALAEAFLDRRCIVVGIALSQESLQAFPALETTGQFFGCVADVAKYDQVESVVNATKSRFGRIDILFNNAAIYPRVNFLEESAQDWARAIDVNVNGVANCCKAVLPLMIEAGAGRIFNIGSFADLSPIENSAAYSRKQGGCPGTYQGHRQGSRRASRL